MITVRTLGLVALVAVTASLGACAAIGTAASVASAGKVVYDYAKEANDIAAVTEKDVCLGYGAYAANKDELGFKTPDALESIEDVVAGLCSSDPVVGTTPQATLKNVMAMVLRLHAAQAPPRVAAPTPPAQPS